MNLFNSDDRFLVTGASSGIGRAIAVALGRAGARVVANGRNKEELRKTADLALTGSIATEPHDLVAGINELPEWLGSLVKKYGLFRGMACAAGITVNAPVSCYYLDKAYEVFDINCHVPLKLGGAFCSPRICGRTNSAIVYVAAGAALKPNPGQGIYAASKAALVAGANCLAKEVAAKHIRVNCISPGLIETPMLDATVKQLGPVFLQKESGRYPFGLGLPEYVADLAVFLLSDKSAWLTGQNIALTGGS